MRLFLVLLPLLVACASKPLPTKSEVTVFTHARVWDGTGAIVDDATVTIRKDRIESIVPHGAIPIGATVVNLSGKTMMPALIAAHAHLGITKDATAGAQNITPENVMHQLNRYRDYGIGAVVSLGTDHEFIYDLRTKRWGNEIRTPLILTAGRGFGVTDGAPPAAMGMDEVYRPTSVEEAIAQVDELAKRKPDLVKLWVDDFGHSMKKKLDPQIYQAVINEAHQQGLKVAAHVYYLSDAKQLARDGVDIFAHSVRDKAVDKAFIDLLKEKNIAYIPTLALDQSFFAFADKPDFMKDEFFKAALEPGVWEKLQPGEYKAKEIARKDAKMAARNLKTLFKAGVEIGMGTDSGATILRVQGFNEHWELALMVDAGLTPGEALQSATSVNARILGIAGDRGTLAAGKKADLLILDADPLLDIRNTRKIHAMYLEGVSVR